MAEINFDAMRQMQKEMQDKHIEAETAYIIKEMFEPIVGMTFIGGTVDGTDLEGMPVFSNPFPLMKFQDPKTGKVIVMMVSADDECNEGGRLISLT